MNALQVMDRYWKEVIQVSTRKNDIKVQYLFDNVSFSGYQKPSSGTFSFMLQLAEYTNRLHIILERYYFGYPNSRSPNT